MKYKSYLYALLFILVVPAVYAQEVEVPDQKKLSYSVTFSFENLHFLKKRDQYSINDQLTLETEAQLVYDNQKNLKIDLKPWLRIDFLDMSRNRYIPNEASIKFYGVHYEFLVGLDVIGIGASNFYNPTDVFNRYDLEDNIYDPDKMGELMLRAKGMTNDLGPFTDVKLEVAIFPWLQETPLPDNDTRFALSGDYNGIPYQLDTVQNMPDSYFRSMGFGVFLSGMLSGFEWEFVYYHGPERMPGYFLTTNTSGALRLRPFYYTIDMIGSNFSLALGSFLFHVELATKITAGNNVVTHDIPGQTDDLVPNNYFQYVPGIDYTIENIFGQGILRMTLEYYGENNTALKLGEYRPFKKDIFFGFEYDFNNPMMTQIKMGFMKDLSNTEFVSIIDFDTKVYRELKFGLRAVFVNRDSDANAPLTYFENNSFVSTRVSWGF